MSLATRSWFLRTLALNNLELRNKYMKINGEEYWKQFHIKITKKIAKSCEEYNAIKRIGTEENLRGDSNYWNGDMSDDSIVFSRELIENGEVKTLQRVIIDKRADEKDIRVSAMYI